MGISASSLLDETKSNYIKGEAEDKLKEFSPYYRKQYSVTRFSEVEDDLEQHKEKITQLLKPREAPEEGEVLYEEGVLFYDDTRKWKERYVVVRANYCLECHDGLETFVKGIPPRQKLLPTGGAVLTTEEKYMAMVDKCFPDDTNVKEDFAPPLSGMPGQFPVYLRLPYRRDSYFCFRQEAKQAAFLSILSDCIRHQNQDFLKKKTCEVQAFLKAIQLYRQDKDKYESWDMLIGSDVRVMANVVMEQLLPSLEKDMLPRLKAKKTEKKRVWFATVEAAYILIQEHLLEGLSALKEECRTSLRQQEVLIHSDMDPILNSRRQLEEKVRAIVSEQAEKLCSESVQPYLASVLEELMEPVSSGFQEGRQLSETTMDQVCQDVLLLADNEQLKKALAVMARPNLLSCFQKIGSLQEKLQHLQERFGFSNITGMIHSAQIDLQQLTENAAYTFEQLLHKAIQDNPDHPGSAIEKAKHRVLKQYDYDSSTVRKRISREALVSITLPFIKKNLAPTCKTELQDLEPLIDADHSNYIHVENVYESILLQSLDKEVTKVVKEAASLRKYNLFTDSRDLLSQSSRSSLSSPPVSTPGSPAAVLASPAKTSVEPQPPSPLAVNGLSSSPEKAEQAVKSPASTEATIIETLLGRVEQKELAPSALVSKEAEATAEEVVQNVKVEAGAPVALEPPALADTTKQSETQEVTVEAAPETVIQEEVFAVETETAETAAEPQLQSTDAPKEEELPSSETPTAAESVQTGVEAAAQIEAPAPTSDATNDPVNTAAQATGSQPGASGEQTHSGSSEIKLEAPSSGQTFALTAADIDLGLKRQERFTNSDPNSLNVSVGSESPPSEVESMEDGKTTQSSQEEVSTTSDVFEDGDNIIASPTSSDDPAGDRAASDESPPQGQAEAVTGNAAVGGAVEAGAGVEVGAGVEAEAVEAGAGVETGPGVEAGAGVEAEAVEAGPGVEAGAVEAGAVEAGASMETEAGVEAGGGVETEAGVEAGAGVEAPDATSQEGETASSPVGCIKEIRDLVVEVIEVEELVKRYPGGVQMEEE